MYSGGAPRPPSPSDCLVRKEPGSGSTAAGLQRRAVRTAQADPRTADGGEAGAGRPHRRRLPPPPCLDRARPLPGSGIRGREAPLGREGMARARPGAGRDGRPGAVGRLGGARRGAAPCVARAGDGGDALGPERLLVPPFQRPFEFVPGTASRSEGCPEGEGTGEGLYRSMRARGTVLGRSLEHEEGRSFVAIERYVLETDCDPSGWWRSANASRTSSAGAFGGPRPGG